MSHERFKAEILPIRDHLFYTARQILSDEDDAEDAVQEVLLRLWNLRDTLGKYDSLPAFATTVTKNHCLDKLRVKKRTDTIDETTHNRAAAENPYLSVER
jgi:RNA polymerase sigma-70 factor (ECF subfamily)